MTTPSPTSSAGFSLIETLIALTLMALISTTVVNAVRTSTQVLRSVDAANSEREEARLLQVASNWLEQANSDQIMRTEPGTMFSGSDKSVGFVVSGIAGPNNGGLSRLKISGEPSDSCPGQFDLILTWQNVMPNYGYTGYGDVRRVLLTCQDHIDFNYFGSVQSGEAPAWRSAWPRTTQLPTIVAINMDGPDGARQLLSRLQYSTRPPTLRAPAARTD